MTLFSIDILYQYQRGISAFYEKTNIYKKIKLNKKHEIILYIDLLPFC